MDCVVHPAALALLCGMALLLHWIFRRRAQWQLAVGSAVFTALVFFMSSLPTNSVFLTLPLLALPDLLAMWRKTPRGAATAWVLFLIVALNFAMAIANTNYIPRSNSFGLISYASNMTETISYEGRKNKDNYPNCVFEYNSLGYRDIEPSFVDDGKYRILVVGDSYVWGDGIPNNNQTLPARLRSHLEAMVPGRTTVMAAGFPGLDLYGYGRIIEQIATPWKADLVLISYLGGVDLELLDVQRLADLKVGFGPLDALVSLLKARQYVHEAYRYFRRGSYDVSDPSGEIERILNSAMVHAQTGGFRLAAFQYDVGGFAPSLTERFKVYRMPPEFACPRKSTELWYDIDYHPRPVLVDRVAAWLAGAILADL